MLVVETYLKEVKGSGVGLFSKNFIPKGTVVWKFNFMVDKIINEEDIPSEAKEFYDIYATKWGKGKIMLCTDNARFINHSKNPNTKSLGNDKDNIAFRTKRGNL